MTQTDSKDLADRLDQEADELESRSQELGQRTKDVAQEWQNKRRDPNDLPISWQLNSSAITDASIVAGVCAARSGCWPLRPTSSFSSIW